MVAPTPQAPRVGVTTHSRDDHGSFAVPAEYVDSLRRAGGVPVVLTPGEPRVDALIDVLDAVVLTGGGDVDPLLYGGRRVETTYHVDRERDEFELALLRHVLDDGLAALCVCRGMQLLNVALGGTLIEHVPDEHGETITHRLPPREPVPHPVTIEPGTRLAELLGATAIEPHSWHHQALRELGAGLTVVARAEDGVGEAVELDGRPDVLAVQWHPELSAAWSPPQQRMFDELVRAAGERG